MDNFSDNLKLLRTEKKLSQQKLADLLDTTRTSITNWENKLSYPTVPSLMALADVLGVSTEELLRSDDILNELGNRLDLSPFKEGKLQKNVTYLDQNGQELTYPYRNVKEMLVLVPGSAQAGYSIDSPGEVAHQLDTVKIPGITGGGMVFEVTGNSMTPIVEHGDYVVCTEKADHINDIINGEVYVVISSESGVTVKYVQKENGGLRLISANRIEYPSYIINFNELREAWRVRLRITSHITGGSSFLSVDARIRKLEQYISQLSLDRHTPPPHSSKQD